MKDYFLSARKFLEHYKIEPATPDFILLSKILNVFSYIPYENISKIIKSSENKSVYESLRLPDLLIEEHILHGLGGTCFSLTFLLKQILDYSGFTNNIYLADRKYGVNTHCCILVEMKTGLFLADAGYLIFSPKLMPRENDSISNFSYGKYNFKAIKTENSIDIYSVFKKSYKNIEKSYEKYEDYCKFRYSIKLQAVSNDIFFDAWEESFKLDMMNHIIVNKYCGDNHIYVKDFILHENTKQINLPASQENITGISKIQWDKAASILSLDQRKMI